MRKEVESIIRSLKSDAKIIGECPSCWTSTPLARWNLFYMNNFPGSALSQIHTMFADVKELEQEYKQLKRKTTTGAEKKSVEVNIGKIVEKVAPALPGFPYSPTDCRTLFEPIDYVIFEGLTEHDRINSIHFIDVKTGDADLNSHEKQIRRAIHKRHVDFDLY